MRVAISADDDNALDSVVSPHFGRCPYYVLVDVDGHEVLQVSAVESPFYGYHEPGAVPAFIAAQGAQVMLAGGMGQRAIALFERAGIEAVTGAAGTVRHALEQYLGGALQGAAACNESMLHGHDDGPDEGEYEHDEVGRLREEIELLQQQLDEAAARLGRIAKL